MSLPLAIGDSVLIYKIHHRFLQKGVYDADWYCTHLLKLRHRLSGDRLRWWHAFKPLKSLFLELCPMVGMGNVDKGVRSLSERLAKQWRNTVFGNNVMGVSTRGYYARANLIEHRNLWFALGGNRRHGQNRFAAAILRNSRAAQEIHLSTEARIDTWSNRIGNDLTGYVDLNARIDCRYLWILANYLIMTEKEIKNSIWRPQLQWDIFNWTRFWFQFTLFGNYWGFQNSYKFLLIMNLKIQSICTTATNQ